jgi:hypothetical protein
MGNIKKPGTPGKAIAAIWRTRPAVASAIPQSEPQNKINNMYFFI